MKAIIFTIFSLFLFISSGIAQRTFNDPVAYNNFIVNEQKQIIEKSLDYIIYSAHNDNEAVARQKRQNVIQQIAVSNQRVKTLKPFRGDKGMRKECLKVFKMYKAVFNNDYKKMGKLKKESTSSFKAMEKYLRALENAEGKLQQAGNRFISAQKAFAKRQGFRILQEENVQNPMEIISQINKYNRNVYREYFRIAILNKNYIEELQGAIRSGKTKQLEKHRKELHEATSLSLSNMEKIPPFNGDSSFRDKAIKKGKYFQALSLNEYSEFVQILSKTTITQQQVDRFNNLVKQVNQETSVLAQEFNDSNREMLRKHIPSER
ncbi:MAG: hypothetical protein ACK4ND_01365 [Cytophagaceae bacterium]